MSVASIRRRTAEKLAETDADPLRCDTSGCGARWTCWFSRGRRCSECDKRMSAAEQLDHRRSLALFPTHQQAGVPPPAGEDDDETVPF